jgi:DNA polymerase-3 subunit delta'
MLLRQVIGQQLAKQGLLGMWKRDHLPHALLVTGAEGRGGLPLALAFAQFIFCTDKQEEDSCGNCPDCQKAGKLEHPDLHVTFPAISPKPGTKALSRHYIQEFREFVAQSPYGTTYDWLQFIDAENKQGNIPAEECREIIDTLNLKSYEGGMKIQIIWRAEYLKKEGNILLKLIEEPPADTLIMLIAEENEDVLPTILSRTQTIRLAPVAVSDIAQGLTDRSLSDPKKASQVAHLSNGSFTEALRLIRQTENDLFPDVRLWFNALFTNNGQAISKFADDWSKAGREQQKNFLHYVVQLLEQATRVRFSPQLPVTLPEEEAQFVRKLAGMNLALEVMHKMVEEISSSIYYIERNAHAKTQLHALSVSLVYAIQGRKSALAAQL